MCWILTDLGIYNSPLDGSDIQTKTPKEPDPRKDKKIKIGMFYYHCSSIFCLANVIVWTILLRKELLMLVVLAEIKLND